VQLVCGVSAQLVTLGTQKESPRLTPLAKVAKTPQSQDGSAENTGN